jgi:holo-ACP synthase CitX
MLSLLFGEATPRRPKEPSRRFYRERKFMDNAKTNAILNEKEARWHRVIQLSNEWEKPVIVGSVVMPGPDKNAPCAEVIFRELVEALEQLSKVWPPLHREVLRGTPGPAVILVLAQGDARLLKRAAVGIEESNVMGRLFDIDVYNEDGRPVSRTELGFSDRRCLVCGGPVSECRRSAKHTLNEVVGKIEEIIKVLLVKK